MASCTLFAYIPLDEFEYDTFVAPVVVAYTPPPNNIPPIIIPTTNSLYFLILSNTFFIIPTAFSYLYSLIIPPPRAFSSIMNFWSAGY